jgi:heme exporter protein C
MRKLFLPLTLVVAGMFMAAPFLIDGAPYESTMGLVQKIFYFHVPSAMTMFVSAIVCGVASTIYLFTGRASADRLAVAAAELASVFGLIVLVTGPLWARKAWGVWWVWDERITSTFVLWLIFNAYLLLRKYGGAGSEKLAAGLAVFGMANVPFVYWSVNVWRTMHP